MKNETTIFRTMLLAVLLFLVSSCQKDSLDKSNIDLQTVENSKFVPIPVWEFDRLKLLPKNATSLNDNKLDEIARIVLNQGVSEQELLYGLEELFKLNPTDFKKCMKKYLELLYSTQIEDALMKDIHKKQISFWINAFDKAENSLNESLIRLEYNNLNSVLNSPLNQLELELKKLYTNHSNPRDDTSPCYTDNFCTYQSTCDILSQSPPVNGEYFEGSGGWCAKNCCDAPNHPNPCPPPFEDDCDIFVQFYIPTYDTPGQEWYFSCSNLFIQIQILALYGELSGDIPVSGTSPRIAVLTIGKAVELLFPKSWIIQSMRLFRTNEI